MSLAFIPLTIHYLGTDAIGMIGLFALLQAWLVVFDLAVRPALWDNATELSPFPLQGGRLGWGSVPLKQGNPIPLGEGLKSTVFSPEPEKAQSPDDADDAQSIRDRLHKLELIGFAIAGAIALGIWASSDWLASVWCATEWLMARHLPVEIVAQVFTVMGVVIALQFIESIYASFVGCAPRTIDLQQRRSGNVPSTTLRTGFTLPDTSAVLSGEKSLARPCMIYKTALNYLWH